jgi:diacylglycerol kinase (ATP)
MTLHANPFNVRNILGRRARPIQIVATPGSGNGRGLHRALELGAALRARGREVRLDLFPDLESLRRWAKTSRAGFSLLISVGGDGTQSTAAGAAMRRAVPFLPVPSGFGNLFAQALGHRRRADRVVELVEHGQLVHVDVGVRNGELFLCQESFGLLVQIQQETEARAAQPRGRWRRCLAYYRTAVHHLRATTPTLLEVAVDDRAVAADAVIVTVANVRTYGAWLPLAPAASPIDGLFDVFIMRAAPKREILAKLLKRHLRLPGADAGTLLVRGRSVVITGPDSARDELALIPRGLRVVVSAETAARLARGVALGDRADQTRLDRVA